MGKGKLKKLHYKHVFYNTVLEKYFIFDGPSYDDAYRRLEDFCDEQDRKENDSDRVGYVDPDDYRYVGSVDQIINDLLPQIKIKP